MTIFAISDLHLSFNAPKPMDIFGSTWENHAQKIAENWDAMVEEDDLVLIAGDHSWAIRFEDAKPDLEFIAKRPGRKIMVRGNHDYWWRREATNRLQRAVDSSITLIQGRAIAINNIGITGTRGWRIEDCNENDAGDEKVLKRELMYLERGLREMPPDVDIKIVVLHYPPFNADLEPNAFAELLQAYCVDKLIYGHIHSGPFLEGMVNGVEYFLAAVDHTNFSPVKII